MAGLFSWINERFKRNNKQRGLLPVDLVSTSPIQRRYGNGSFYSFLTQALPSSNLDWSKEAGDLMCNSVVSCCMDWYVRNWTQARVAIRRQTDQQGDHYTYIRTHPVLNLIRYPQPNVTPSTFWGWVIVDYKLLGNAYVRKVRVG